MAQYKEKISERNKQRPVVEFLNVENAPPADIQQQIKVVYKDDNVDVGTDEGWTERVCDANLVHADISRTEHSGMRRTANEEAPRNYVV
jgi:hypothetical protein